MRTPWAGRACRSLVVPLVAVALLAAAYRDGPPPAHTGGFGEPTCRACHFDAPLNAPGGRLALDGLPPAYEGGRTYRLTVHLLRPGMRAGGFELAARVAATGRQAGAFHPLDDRVQAPPDSVVYARHTRAGSRLAVPDTARWALLWQAPPAAAGPVVFHLAANAANDDDSEFGDVIYTTRRTLPPE